MLDLPGVVFVGAACFLIGVVLVDLFWDTRVLERPYDETQARAINAFYRNNLIGMRRRAPLLIALFPAGFLVVFGALGYKLATAWSAGDAHAIRTSGVSLALLVPLLFVAGLSTFPTIGILLESGDSLPVERQQTLHRRLLWQHVVIVLLTAVAVVLHIVL